MAYDNTNRGSIWKNEKKEQDTHPDFTGSQNVCCAKCGEQSDYWVSAWKRKEGAAPKAPALSFSVKPKEQRSQAPRAKPGRPSADDDMGGDSIPF
jgi:hypothetical protein